jgi:glycosyltransferase involved in cell wall biosynthesis
MALKILLLSHKFNPDIGGIEAHSEILATSFSEAGNEVHLITWSNKASTITFPFSIIRNPGLLLLVREHKWADIVFENNPSLRLSWPALFLNKPLIVVLHTWITRPSGKTGWQDRLKHLWLARARKVVSCSNAIRKQSWPESVVIKNPYQENTFRPLNNILRTHDFVFLGRLVSDKGVNVAIKAFSKILLKYKTSEISKDLYFTIIGDGAERENLENESRSLGLQEKVVFTGSLRGEALVTCLNKHKYLIVPSMWEEPFGMVALEGMACGCIPIVSDGGGLPEAVGDAGIIFRRGDVDSLVDSMLKIIENDCLQKELRQLAVLHLKAHCSKVVTQQYEAIIKEVLNLV